MIPASVLAMLAASAPLSAGDYGQLHYLYAGALGDQGCADGKPNGLRRRRFESRYGQRVRLADRWYETHYPRSVLTDALAGAYGNPDLTDVRDCLMTAAGRPAFRDTDLFVSKLRSIERGMKGKN